MVGVLGYSVITSGVPLGGNLGSLLIGVVGGETDLLEAGGDSDLSDLAGDGVADLLDLDGELVSLRVPDEVQIPPRNKASVFLPATQ